MGARGISSCSPEVSCVSSARVPQRALKESQWNPKQRLLCSCGLDPTCLPFSQQPPITSDSSKEGPLRSSRNPTKPQKVSGEERHPRGLVGPQIHIYACGWGHEWKKCPGFSVSPFSLSEKHHSCDVPLLNHISKSLMGNSVVGSFIRSTSPISSSKTQHM